MRIKRGATLRVRLDPETLERFKRLAGTLGLPTSTLGAVAIGTYLAQQERNVQIVERVATSVGEEAAAMMRGPVGQQLKLIMEAKSRRGGRKGR
jgi:predicted transcriptional regulator